MACEAAVSTMESRMAYVESVIAPGERSPALAHVRQDVAAVGALPILCTQTDVVQVVFPMHQSDPSWCERDPSEEEGTKVLSQGRPA
jgi:hypothetical protein